MTIDPTAYIRRQEARQDQDAARERWKDHPPVGK